MDGSRDCHTEWGKSERVKQISYINACMWNLEKWYRWTGLQGRSWDTDVENKCMDTKGGKPQWRGDGGVLNWAIGVDIYTLMCIKLMTNKNLQYKQTNKQTKNPKQWLIHHSPPLIWVTPGTSHCLKLMKDYLRLREVLFLTTKRYSTLRKIRNILFADPSPLFPSGLGLSKAYNFLIHPPIYLQTSHL